MTGCPATVSGVTSGGGVPMLAAAAPKATAGKELPVVVGNPCSGIPDGAAAL